CLCGHDTSPWNRTCGHVNCRSATKPRLIDPQAVACRDVATPKASQRHSGGRCQLVFVGSAFLALQQVRSISVAVEVYLHAVADELSESDTLQMTFHLDAWNATSSALDGIRWQIV